jgi:hypothetical protein
MTFNEAVSSVRNRSGEERRFVRHQSSISWIGASAQEWSGPGGSPPLAQFVQNRRRWPKVTRLGGFPGRGQRLVQSATLLVGEVITFVVRDEVDNCSLGQGCRLV